METSTNKWQGKRAIVVVRQSSDKDGTASTAAQLDYMSQELAKVGMTYVDRVTLEGVPGSAPARMTEVLEGLIERKKKHDDFDVIAWMVEDRASRGGGGHGMWQEHEALRHGIRFFFAGDDQPTGPYASVIRVVKYEAAKEGNVNSARRSVQGQSWAQQQGFFRTSGQTPLGCDRLYYGPDDKAKFIIHNLPSGLQEQRDFTTGVVIGSYGTVGKKSKNRFRKQRNEFSLLVPGDRAQRQVVRVIFYMRYKKGWRGVKIADFLNRQAVPTPKGKEWSQRQAQIIYENTAYTGVTYNDKTFSGRYFRRDKTLGFVALDRDECDLVLKKTFVPKMRPQEDWEQIDQPHMYDFLPRDVRDLAVVAQTALLKERADPSRPVFKPNAHPSSDYLLSGKLRAVQDDGVLVGTLSGPPNKKTAYYRHCRSKRGHVKGSVYNNLIPAKPLLEAVVAILAEIMADTPDLKARLTQHVLDQRADALQDRPNVAALEAERDEITQQIKATIRLLRGPSLQDAEDELARLGHRRNVIEAKLEAIRDEQQDDARPVEEVVNEALAVIAEGGRRMTDLSPEPLRHLVNQLVADATVDMATKAVELSVNLPTWTLQSKQKTEKTANNGESTAENRLCLAASSWSPTLCWTQSTWATVRCDYQAIRGSTVRPVCYECRRIALAA